MGLFGTKVRRLIAVSCLTFVPYFFAAEIDITKGEFKGAIEGTSKPEKKTASTSPKRKAYPFHGNLASVDGAKNLLVLQGKKQRSIRIDSDTKITRNGVTTALSEGKPGERVTGSVTRDEQGQELAVSVKFNGVVASASNATRSTRNQKAKTIP